MPTRPIGPGTRNLSINAPDAMAQAIGRIAWAEGYRSVGELARELFAQRITQARARGLELARDARQLVLPLAMCFIAVVGLVAVALAAVCSDDFQARRMVRRRRRREDEIGIECLVET
jgi:hypothetical protein